MITVRFYTAGSDTSGPATMKPYGEGSGKWGDLTWDYEVTIPYHADFKAFIKEQHIDHVYNEPVLGTFNKAEFTALCLEIL